MFRKIVVLSLILLTQCVSHVPEKTQKTEKNDFSLDWEKKNQASKIELQDAIWSFFIFSRDISKDRIPYLKKKQALLSSVHDIQLHGDPHPLSVIELNKKMYLNGLERSFSGPWWWDVLRIENGASAIAEYQSFLSYKTGLCLSSYRNILSEYVLNPRRIEQNVLLKDNALLPRQNNENHKDFQIRKLKSDEVSMAPEIQEALAELMKKELSLQISVVQSVVANSPESNFEVYQVTDQNKNKWLLKKIDGSCVDFHKALIHYSPGRKLYCLQAKGSNYSLRQIESTEFIPNIEYVESNYQLMRNLRAVCSQLAYAHIKLSSDRDIKVIASLLNTNPQFYNYLLRFFDQEYREISQAYKDTL